MADAQGSCGGRGGITAESLIEAVWLIETLGGSVTVYMPDGRAIGVTLSEDAASIEEAPAPAPVAVQAAPEPEAAPVPVAPQPVRPVRPRPIRRPGGSTPQPVDRPGVKLRSAPSYSAD